MSIHQLTPRKNSASRADRVLRAAACAIVRMAWELVLLDEPVMAEAVRTAERHVRRETDDSELASARDAAVITRAPVWWSRCLNVGALGGVAHLSVREACRATCAESPSEALEKTVGAVARAWAAHDVNHSPVQRAVSEMLSMNTRRTVWTKVFRTLHVDLLETFDIRCRVHAYGLKGVAERRIAAGDDRTQGPRQPIVLPQSYSLLLFGWGLPLLSKGELPVDDPDGLLQHVVRHSQLDVLWRECRRADWRAWLLTVARIHGVVEQKLEPKLRPDLAAQFRAALRSANARAREATPFARTLVHWNVLHERRDQVWYSLDPAAQRLEVGAIWCMFGVRPQGVPELRD